MASDNTAPEGATDPWATVRVYRYDAERAEYRPQFGRTYLDEQDVERARAAVEAQHQRDRELLMDTILKQDAEIARLTQERDKYRNGIEAALDSNEATKVLKFRISGLNDELAAVKAERDALAAQLAATTAERDTYDDRLDALAAQVAMLREALAGHASQCPQCHATALVAAAIEGGTHE